MATNFLNMYKAHWYEQLVNYSTILLNGHVVAGRKVENLGLVMIKMDVEEKILMGMIVMVMIWVVRHVTIREFSVVVKGMIDSAVLIRTAMVVNVIWSSIICEKCPIVAMSGPATGLSALPRMMRQTKLEQVIGKFRAILEAQAVPGQAQLRHIAKALLDILLALVPRIPWQRHKSGLSMRP